jgi:predicted amidohydrolase YtcJ
MWIGPERAAGPGALLVVDDRIRATGEVEALWREHPDAEEIAIGRGFVIPGLIDTHAHMLMAGESLAQLDLSRARSREDFEELIAQRHGDLPEGQWLLAHGWSQENWEGGELPDRSWLRAAGGRPVVAWRMDSHVCVVNDAVLARIDLAREPEGGRLGRTANGEANGLFFEAAAWQLVRSVVPKLDAPQRQEALRAAMQVANSLGLTTIGSMEYGRDVHSVFEPVADELTARVRITLLDRDWPLDFSFGEEFVGDEFLDVIGYKTFLDGTLGARTARMLDDYSDDPGNRGMWCELAAQGLLGHWIQAVAQRGFQPAMHAIGDAASRLALEAIHSLSDDLAKSVRPRIEHAQQLHEKDIPRFAKRGTIASMQPLHRADDGRYALRRVGPERIHGTFVFRKLRDVGARLAFGSDWPIVSCDPMTGIRAAVTGLTLDGELFCPEQNLTVDEALRAYTIDAARALCFEDEVGSLDVGKLADLVVLDRDPITADWINSPPQVKMTMISGEIVFDHHARDGGHSVEKPTTRIGLPRSRD